MLFFPYEFKFDKEYEFFEGIEQIQEALNNDFKYVLQYRNCVANVFDTYMAYIYDKHIVFMQQNNNAMKYVDSVELVKSPVYQNLLSYGNLI